MPVFNAIVRGGGVNPWIQDFKIWPQETRNVPLSNGAESISISWTV